MFILINKSIKCSLMIEKIGKKDRNTRNHLSKFILLIIKK